MLALILSFLAGRYFKRDACNQYVWSGSIELCIPDDLVEYISKLQGGAVNRLKSKRGIFPK